MAVRVDSVIVLDTLAGIYIFSNIQGGEKIITNFSE